MKLIILTHPNFLTSQSMPKFANLIYNGMISRGHTIEVWTPKALAYKLPVPLNLKKWLGYFDQFVLFPISIYRKLNKIDPDTIFVIADQALGPWVPLIANRPHVIHVHDFMALRSAMGEFKQNTTSWPGRIYQSLIKRGFNHGKRFISVSKKSQADLQRFLTTPKEESITIYNGLNYPFEPMSFEQASTTFLAAGYSLPTNGFFLHVGGNQWYKNRMGVLEIYSEYSKKIKNPIPLIMIGAPPTNALQEKAELICNSSNGHVAFLVGVPTEVICAAYSTANAFIFPSIAEGFGWPIIEAMACGCTVLTTNEAPMTEIGGSLAVYIPSINDFETTNSWASHCADILNNTMAQDLERNDDIRSKRIKHTLNFDLDKTLNEYEAAYYRAIKRSTL